jgi:uncharacterized protein (DUF3820 family)
MTDQENDWLKSAVRELAEIAKSRMPFGKYGPKNYPPDGVPIYDLPAEYLQYFALRGWPKGKLGHLMKVVYHTKADGGDSVFDCIRKQAGGRTKLRHPRQRYREF